MKKAYFDRDINNKKRMWCQNGHQFIENVKSKRHCEKCLGMIYAVIGDNDNGLPCTRQKMVTIAFNIHI